MHRYCMAVHAIPATRTYHANLLRLWELWVVQVPDAEGVHALVTQEADAEEAARQAVALLLDIDPRSVEVILDRD